MFKYLFKPVLVSERHNLYIKKRLFKRGYEILFKPKDVTCEGCYVNDDYLEHLVIVNDLEQAKKFISNQYNTIINL